MRRDLYGAPLAVHLVNATPRQRARRRLDIVLALVALTLLALVLTGCGPLIMGLGATLIEQGRSSTAGECPPDCCQPDCATLGQ